MSHAILFRKGSDHQHEEEFAVASKYFPVVEYRSKCPPNSTIIARYSALPFYRELVEDLSHIGSKLLNSWGQHSWIADFDYYEDLKNFTPETWTDHDFYTSTHPGPFIVKGRTNSRKQQWNTLMFAKDKRAALEIAGTLAADDLIGPQGVIYRKYVPLVTYETGINGLPFTNEWRIFYYRDQRLSHGYYWTSSSCPEKASITDEAFDFADRVANIAKEHVDFFVLDIAEKKSGGWILVEINSGFMSGLSANDPDTLYSNLRIAIDK